MTWEEFEGLGKSLKDLGKIWRTLEEFEGLGKSLKDLGRV
jgi:hypothetical protein